MMILLSLLLSFTVNASVGTPALDEFLVDDSFKSAGQKTAVLNYSYECSEIEDENRENSAINFCNSAATLGLEYQLSDKIQYRVVVSQKHNYRSINQKGSFNDPDLLIWYRYSAGKEITRDFGLEVSPSLGTDNIFKNKSGHSVSLKYRFGLGHEYQRIHGTYLLGIKKGSSFIQDGIQREYESATFWGASISMNQHLYKIVSLSVNAKAIRLSQNQSEVYFERSDSGSAWETSLSLIFNLKVTKASTVALGYGMKNESSTLNKLGTNLDIEAERKRGYLSFKTVF